MLSKGSTQGEWAINELANRYTKSQGFTQEPTLLAGDGQPQSGFQPLSKAEYTAAMRDAQYAFVVA